MKKGKSLFVKSFLNRKKLAIPTQSTRMVKEENNISEQIAPTDYQSNNISLHSIKTIKYGSYIEIRRNGDKRRLIISGEPTQQQLEECWEEILLDYSDNIQTEKSASTFDLWKRIAYTEWKQNFLNVSLRLLKYKYNEEVAKEIHSLGYALIVECEKREDYLKQIYSIQSETDFLTTLLNQYDAQFALLCKKEGVEEPEMRDIDYEKELSILSRFMKFRIKRNKITLFEFIAYTNDYLDYFKKQRNARR